MLDCWPSRQQGELQPVFNCEALGARCRHARMFVLPAQYFREDIKHPVKRLQEMARVKLWRMVAVTFNMAVPLSRVSLRISRVILESTFFRFLDDIYV